MNAERRELIRTALTAVESVKSQLDYLAADEECGVSGEPEARDARVRQWTLDLGKAASTLTTAVHQEKRVAVSEEIRKARNLVDEMSCSPAPELFNQIFRRNYDEFLARVSKAVA